jgi:hypothetical protein
MKNNSEIKKPTRTPLIIAVIVLAAICAAEFIYIIADKDASQTAATASEVNTSKTAASTASNRDEKDETDFDGTVSETKPQTETETNTETVPETREKALLSPVGLLGETVVYALRYNPQVRLYDASGDQIDYDELLLEGRVADVITGDGSTYFEMLNMEFSPLDVPKECFSYAIRYRE